MTNEQLRALADPCPFCGAPVRWYTGHRAHRDTGRDKQCGTHESPWHFLRSDACLAATGDAAPRRVPYADAPVYIEGA